jgi:hypothetical protein
LSIVSITVVSIKPVKFGKIFALVSVEIDIDEVLLVLLGVAQFMSSRWGPGSTYPCSVTKTVCGAERSR